MSTKRYLFLSAAVFAAALAFSMAGCNEKQPTATTYYTLTIDIDPRLGGSVDKSPDSTSYASGSTVQVTAKPSLGYIFAGWTGASTSTDDTISLKINSDVSLTAKFEKAYVLTTATDPADGSGGTVKRTPDKNGYQSGAVVTLTAKAADGYEFAGWEGDTVSTKDSIIVTIGDADMSVTAKFLRLYKIAPSAVPTVGGTVAFDKQGPYSSGTVVEATATPKAGFVFSRWSGSGAPLGEDDVVAPVALIAVNSDLTLTANFRQLDKIAADTLADARDNQKYVTVKIGDYTWMAKNLNYETDDSDCYGDDADNCARYGRLYDWADAVEVCPSGWSLPDSAAWENLIQSAGGNNAGVMLKSTSASGIDTYGFSAMLGGKRENGSFEGAGASGSGNWWVATAIGPNHAYRYNASASAAGMASAVASKGDGYSVRCIKGSTVTP